MKYTANLKRLIREVNDRNMVSGFTRIGKVFYDEPTVYFFTANLDDGPSYRAENGYVLHDHLSSCGGAGLSFHSEYLAVLKSLSEAVERFSGMVYRKDDIINRQYNSIRSQALEPGEFGEKIRGITKWVRGAELTGRGGVRYLPAQLMFLHSLQSGEPELTVRTSTGTASGFSWDEALLRGIYEIVERDCFMTAFYQKIPLRGICPQEIRNREIEDIYFVLQRYRLEWHLFAMENDLEIPAFLSVIVDRSGLGPAVSAGMKAGLDTAVAISGSVTEAFMSRLKMRHEVYAKHIRSFRLKKEDIRDHIDRGLYWYPTSRLKELDWLLLRQCNKPAPASSSGTVKEQTALVSQRLQSKGYRVYYYDLTLPNFRKIGFHTVKAIIPRLQPLHTDEHDKLLSAQRMGSVARYFGKKNGMENRLPHFF